MSCCHNFTILTKIFKKLKILEFILMKSNYLMMVFMSDVLMFQVAKARPSDKDAQAKYNECNKIVKRLAFEKAIAVEDTKKSVADSINLDKMSEFSMLAPL